MSCSFVLSFFLFSLLQTIAIASYGESVYLNTADYEAIVISTDKIQGGHVVEIQSPSHSPASRDLGNLSSNKAQSLPFHQEVLKAASTTALSPALIHAVITVESKYNPQAISRAGAYGLMQLMPATAKQYGLNGLRSATHEQHILAGARYLKELILLFNGDLELALAAYNAGPASVKKYHHQIPPFQETKRYVPKVLKWYRQYSS